MQKSARQVSPRGLTFLLGVLTAVGPLAIDTYLPGLPEITRTLHTSPGAAARTVAIFFIGMAVGQLVYGPLSDRKGRRGPLLAGLGLFLVGSIGCALAPSIEVLMATRLLQAIGACSTSVIARAIVRDRFAPQESAKIFSRLILVMGVSPIFAPLLGGAILLFSDWRMIFWVLTAIGCLVTIAVVFLLAESRPKDSVSSAGNESVVSSYVAVLRNREIIGYILAAAFTGGALTTYIAISPSVLIGVYHIPVQAFAWIFSVNGFGLIAASQINVRLIHRHRPSTILRRANIAALLMASTLFANTLTNFGQVLGLLVPLFFLISSIGFNMPNALASAMAHDPHRAGATSALIGTAQFTVGAIGATVASLLHDGTARPMTSVILASILTATLVLYTLAPRD